MDKIIYATDFSEESKKALRYANELCKRSGAQLMMLHVFDIPTIWNSETEGPTFPEMAKDMMETKVEMLKDFYEAVLDNEVLPEKVGLEARESASPVLGILDCIKEYRADLVVMGTKGKHKARELFIGSTTMSVIKQSNCPVLSVPQEANYQELNKILYATDFDSNDIDALKRLSVLSQMYNTKILVEHITETTENEAENDLSILKAKAEEAGIDQHMIFGLTVAADVFTGLMDFVTKNDIDLLVMLERDNRTMNRWFHRDLVKRMENHTKVPILTYNEKHVVTAVTLDQMDTNQIG